MRQFESALQFAAHSVPIFPVRVYRVGEHWRKQPHIRDWSARATTSAAQIEEWWRNWPDAVVGVPLARVGLVVIDADRHGGPDGVAALQAIELAPHPIVTTMSNGEHHFFRQPAPPIDFIAWEGGQVLGHGRMVVAYDLAPFITPAPVLPMDLLDRLPKTIRPQGGPQQGCVPETCCGGLLDALRQMNPCDWSGQNEEWFKLMTACRWVGISCADFIAWSIGDPDYANHAPEIARRWRSLRPKNGGSLRAALIARGIRPPQQPSVGHPHQATIDWRARLNSVLNKLQTKPDGDMLFWAGCRVAEIMADTGKPQPSVAMELLVGRVWSVIERKEAVRVIGNAFSCVEKQTLDHDSAKLGGGAA
jgi:hypothetical protein